MPYVTEGPKEPAWGTKNGAALGLVCGMGSAGVLELGADRIMWGSDFPHPDGVWPDSRGCIQKELGHLPDDVRRQIVCENARRLYGFTS